MQAHGLYTDISKAAKTVDLAKKYPGGRWVTMKGRHIYIMKDGKPAPETPMPEKAAKSPSGKAVVAKKPAAKVKTETTKTKATGKPVEASKKKVAPTTPKKVAPKDATGKAEEKPVRKKAASEKVADIRVDVQKNRKVAYDVGSKIGSAKKDRAYWQEKFKAEPTNKTLEDMEKADPMWAIGAVTRDNTLPKFTGEEYMKEQQAKGRTPMSAWIAGYVMGKVAKKPEETAQARAAYVSACRQLYDMLEQAGAKGSTFAALHDLRLWMQWGDDPDKHIARKKEAIKKIKELLALSDAEMHAKSPVYQLNLQKDSPERIARIYALTRKSREDSLKNAEEFVKRLKKIPKDAFTQFRALGPDFTKLFTRSDAWENFMKAYDGKPHEWEQPKLGWEIYWGDKAERAAAVPGEAKVKVKWERQMPEVVRRIGGRKVAMEKPEELVKKYGFRGVEFGNWVDDHSGKFHLGKAAEALADLADVLGVNDKQVSFNGRLGLAFGARGTGSALAHYEPMLTVINLTKEHGTGSLAHEWGHALDHAVAALNKGGATLSYASEGLGEGAVHADVKRAYKDVMKAIMESSPDAPGLKTLNFKEAKNFRPTYGALKISKAGPITPEVIEQVTQAMFKQNMENIDYSMSLGWYPSPEVREQYREKRVAKAVKDIAAMAQDLMNLHNKTNPEAKITNVKIPTTYSQYMANSLSYESSGKPYWSTRVELFARAFESYVQDKLAAKKCHNDYLVTGTKGQQFGSPYPYGKERENINAAFDKLVASMHKAGDLKKALQILAMGSLQMVTLQKGISEEMAAKYPGGKWETMHGHHVYIKKDGVPAKETLPADMQKTSPEKQKAAKEKADFLGKKSEGKQKEPLRKQKEPLRKQTDRLREALYGDTGKQVNAFSDAERKEAKQAIEESLGSRLVNEPDFSNWAVQNWLQDQKDNFGNTFKASEITPGLKENIIKNHVSELVKSWAMTSADSHPKALALQRTAQAIFGLASAKTDHFPVATPQEHAEYMMKEWKKWDAYAEDCYIEHNKLSNSGANAEEVEKAWEKYQTADKLAKTMHDKLVEAEDSVDVSEKDKKAFAAFLKAQYAETQAFFDKNGITHVQVYRGMKGDADTSNPLREAKRRHNEAAKEANAARDKRTRMNEHFEQLDYYVTADKWQPHFASKEEAIEARNAAHKAVKDEYKVVEAADNKKLKAQQELDALKAKGVAALAGDASIELQPMSSFSTDFATAKRFSRAGSNNSILMVANVPAKHILSTCRTGFGCLTEGEVVVLGHPLEGKAIAGEWGDWADKIDSEHAFLTAVGMHDEAKAVEGNADKEQDANYKAKLNKMKSDWASFKQDYAQDEGKEYDSMTAKEKNKAQQYFFSLLHEHDPAMFAKEGVGK